MKARTHITFRSSAIRSGMSGSGHSKPIIIGSNTAVVRPPSSRQECSGMCAKFGSSTNPPLTKKKRLTSVMRDTRGWKSKRLLLPSLRPWQIYYRHTDTLALCRPRNDFSQVVSRQPCSRFP